MKEKKKIIALAGPSGGGKSTLAHFLLERDTRFSFSISATTRFPRNGEQDGKDYYFLSEHVFQKHIDTGDFIEWEEVYPGRFYGTLKKEIERIFQAGNLVVFDIDVLGAQSIKKQFGEEAVIVFVRPESVPALRERLRGRGTESEEEIEKRAERFVWELSQEEMFDHVIVNTTGEQKTAEQELFHIVQNNF